MRTVDDTGVPETEGTVCEHFQRAAEILGRRWNPQVIRVLLYGPARFGELRERVPGISDNLLSERLKWLEAEGIVLRTVRGSRPVLIEYSLTESGAGLGKAIDALAEWAEQFAIGKTPAAVR
jgi:DNA-binding HxlR family transcriptional regulator